MDDMITISVEIPREQALEFKVRLGEYGQQARAVRKFVKVFIMKARAAGGKDIDMNQVVDESAEEAAAKLVEGGLK